MDRKVEWEKLMLAFLIAVFLFSFGLFIGYLTKGIIEGSTISIEESTRDEIISLETITLLDKSYPCQNASVNLVSDKLDYLGKLISTLEAKNGKNDGQVLELKKLYTVMEVRHMLLMKERGERCGGNYSIFLFFYSNEKDCDGVKESSFILSYLRNKYDNVRVYSFDVNLESDLISVLKNRHGVTTCRTIVLNDKKVGGDTNREGFLEELIE